MTEKLTDRERGEFNPDGEGPSNGVIDKLLRIHDAQAAVLELVRRAVSSGYMMEHAVNLVRAALSPVPAQSVYEVKDPNGRVVHETSDIELAAREAQRQGPHYTWCIRCTAGEREAWRKAASGEPAPAQAAEPETVIITAAAWDAYSIALCEAVDERMKAEARVAELEREVKVLGVFRDGHQGYAAKLEIRLEVAAQRADALQSRADEAVKILESQAYAQFPGVANALEVLRGK